MVRHTKKGKPMTDEHKTEETTPEAQAPRDSQASNNSSSNKSDIIKDMKGYSIPTFVCIGLAALFLVLCCVDTVAVRWWVMVPIAIAGIVTAYKQKSKVSGTERLVCVVALWALVCLFLLRDVVMSSKLADVLDGLSGMAKAFEDMGSMFE